MALTPQPYFVDAPFASTASQEASHCWAARRDVLQNLERLCRRYINRPDSSLDLMWANLGAGKTHALFHLMHLLAKTSPTDVVIYIELPEQPKNFLEIFRRVAIQLASEERLNLLERIGASASDDVSKALRVYNHGDGSQRGIAVEWLTGGRPQLRELKALAGIGARIEDDTKARDVFTSLVKRHAANGSRVVLLIDEFQRLRASRSASRDAILSNLRSVFSSNATYFSVVLAATSLIEQTALDSLTPELRTLTSLRPAISLPEMSPDEATQFLVGRFRCFRPPGYAAGELDPFGQTGIEAIVQVIAQSRTDRLIPRTLLQLSGLVYDELLYRGISEASGQLVQDVFRVDSIPSPDE